MSDTLKNLYAYVADMPGPIQSKLELVARTLAGYLKFDEVHLTLSTEDKEFTGTTSSTLQAIKEAYPKPPIIVQHTPSTTGEINNTYILTAEGFSKKEIPRETIADFQYHIMTAAEFFCRIEKEKELENVKAQLVVMKQKIVHDPLLTELLNRQGLEEVLTAEIERSKRSNKSLGLIYADIDHFKEVNDKYGHQAGDQVLLQIGSVLRTKSRPYDHVARIGGEEFAIVLPEIDFQSTKDIALRLLFAVSNQEYTIRVPAFSCTINKTISLGATTINKFKENTKQIIQELFQKADKLLYQAKNTGRNRVLAEHYQH